MSTPKLTASYVTLAGAGFAEPPRFTFRQRCEAASAVGFARIGIHLNDLKTLKSADVADILSDNNLELGEIEFFAGWAAPGAESATRVTLGRCGSWPQPPAAVIISVRVTSLAVRWISTVPLRA